MIRLSKSILVVVVWYLANSGAQAAEEINEKNWVNHPEIVEVRSRHQAVKELKDAGKLKKNERRFIYCEPYEDTQRVLYTDAKGKPRIYYYTGGSDDSSVETELYYDENGKLRFAFITAGAYNGTELEHRVYFSRMGKKIWEDQKPLKGPGYTFPEEWPEAELIQDPLRAYADNNACEEYND